MREYPQVLLAHPGTQYSYQLAAQLATRGSLGEFWTGFALPSEARSVKLLHRLLPLTWQRRIANRLLTVVPGNQLRTMPLVEWKALREMGRGKPEQVVLHQRNQVFQERIPRASLQKASAVIGFDTSSWVLARRTRDLGKSFFLDQSTTHPLTKEAILKHAAVSYPEWREGSEQRVEKVLAFEHEEHRLATKIVAASRFARETLVANGVDKEKIVVNPYGVDLELFHPARRLRESKLLRFLFLGSVSVLKGVPLLLEAWKNLAFKNAELWVVGPITDRQRRLLPPLPNMTVLGRYPHRELPELLRQCDLLVFPSYCEGFGLVLLEALASGLPIITTDTTAGPDLIQDGIEGRLIRSGSLEALCEAMRAFADHRDDLESMSKAARRCAEGFSWDSYGDRWNDILQEWV